MHGAACAGMSAMPKPKVSNALNKPEKNFIIDPLLP
jgi:hypothetical protein